MKRFPIYMILLLTAMAVGTVSCSRTSTVETPTETETETQEDSLLFAIGKYSLSDRLADISVYVTYPERGSGPAADSLRCWILSTLDVKRVTDPSFFVNADSVAVWYTQQHLRHVKKEIGEDKETLDWMKENEIKYEVDDSIYVEYRSKNCICMGSMNYSYSGGAHGGTAVSSTIVRLSDGKVFGWNIFSDRKELKTIIKEGLKEYFEVKTDKELLENLLFEGEDYSKGIPMPQSDPILTDDGILLIYQQYEIAPYAAGMPQIVIPYDKAKKYLTKEACDMICR